MAALLSDFAAEKPDSAALRPVLEKLFGAAGQHPEPRSAAWMLIAVQGLTRPLLPLLSASDAGTVCALLEKIFPRSQRLPVQDELRRELRKRAKE